MNEQDNREQLPYSQLDLPGAGIALYVLLGKASGLGWWAIPVMLGAMGALLGFNSSPHAGRGDLPPARSRRGKTDICEPAGEGPQ